MQIDERPVPEAVVDALCRLADKLAPALILANGGSTLFQGHRVLPQNVPVARKHLKSLLRSSRTLALTTITLLQSGGLATEVVTVLSTLALELGFADLAACYGEADFLAATLLDEREAVRTLAHDFIAGWDGQSADDSRREQALQNLQREFASFLAHLKALRGEALPAGPHADKDEPVAAKGTLDKALDAARADLARVGKKTEAERKALQDRIDQKQKETDRLRSDLLAARNETSLHQAAIAALRKAHHELQTCLQQQIDNGVGKALSDRVRQWLEPVQAVEEAIAGARQSDLLARSVQALDRQRAGDRHFANRTTLAHMIEERRGVLAQMQSARIDALNPLPELAELATELEGEISALAHRLGHADEQPTATMTGLLAGINAARTLDALAQVRQFIQQAAAYELLQREELQRLYRATHDKAGLLYDRARIVDKDRESIQQTGFFLRHALAHGQPFTLFIDGHNVLYSLKHIFGAHFLDGHPGSKARHEFASCLTRIFSRPGADVLLYFDGEDPAQHALSDQVRVFYSGGTGEHRADAAILEHLQAYPRSGSPAAVCLVTKDAEFARQASALGVNILHPEEFAIALDLTAG